MHVHRKCRGAYTSGRISGLKWRYLFYVSLQNVVNAVYTYGQRHISLWNGSLDSFSRWQRKSRENIFMSSNVMSLRTECAIIITTVIRISQYIFGVQRQCPSSSTFFKLQGCSFVTAVLYFGFKYLTQIEMMAIADTRVTPMACFQKQKILPSWMSFS